MLIMRWTGRVRFVFLLPAVVWVLAFTVFPLGYSLYLAFFKLESKVEVVREKVPVLDEEGEPVLLSSGKPRTRNVVHKNQVTTSEFVGLFNFERLLGDPQVATAIRVTAVFVLVAVPTQLALGMLLALLFNQQLLARPVLRTVMILPIFATPLAVGYLFFTIFYEEGGPLGFLGIPFLSNPTLPLLQPTILIVLLLRLAEALKLFDIPFALTGGGPGVATQSYSFLAFRVGLRYFDLGYASAMAYVLLIVVMIIVTLFFRRLRETYA